MLKDRAQKATALRLSVSMHWLPQLEVEVAPERRLEKTKYLLTDLDVLAVTQTIIGQQNRLVFDCKSSAKESAISRTFWLSGVMTKTAATHGFVVLNDKVFINRDHRVSASELLVTLVHESELPDLAKGMGGSIKPTDSYTANIDVWEHFLSIPAKYEKLHYYTDFARSTYWMIKDPGERCRKTLARLRGIREEMDPTKPEHLSIFGDAVCLFLLALSELSTKLFLVLLRPSSEEEFSSSLLAYLYGGFQSLETAQKIRQITSGVMPGEVVNVFPQQEKFEILVREILEAPEQAMKASLLAREMSFTFLVQGSVTELQSELVKSFKYTPKYLLMVSEYLQKAASLPLEFSEHYSNASLYLASEALRSNNKA